MAQTARVKTPEVQIQDGVNALELSARGSSIRVSPNSYFATIFLLTFFTGFLVYLRQDSAALIVLAIAWVGLPLLAWMDRIVFDGERLYRTGIVPRIWNKINGKSGRLKILDIEQVETQATRALKRGGSVFYRYRTSIAGKGNSFVFATGGESYRQMVRNLFHILPDEILDNRSIELRDYLSEPKEVLMKAEFARIPSKEVLEDSLNEFTTGDKTSVRADVEYVDEASAEKADYLRELANQLRLSGNLLQALETFRRALRLNPFDGWLLFEFGRCLHSYASSERNEKLEHKAKAALRLAEHRAGKDSELLARLGESYFQYGEWERARGAFNKALSVAGESFRSVRGLAEIALREGKIAHVIHHFSSAAHFADSVALKNWARNEKDYFAELSGNDNYMESEIRRINMLENMEKGKRLSMRFALVGMIIVIFGVTLDDELIANSGWAISSVALLIWAGMMMSRNIMSERNPILAEED